MSNSSSSIQHTNYMLNELDKTQKALLVECEAMLSKSSVSSQDIQQARVLVEKIDKAKKAQEMIFASIDINYYSRVQKLAQTSSREVVCALCGPLIEKAEKEVVSEGAKAELASIREQLKGGIDVWGWLYARLVISTVNCKDDELIFKVLSEQIKRMRSYHHSGSAP
jgi:hypothetical protein